MSMEELMERRRKIVSKIAVLYERIQPAITQLEKMLEDIDRQIKELNEQ